MAKRLLQRVSITLLVGFLISPTLASAASIETNFSAPDPYTQVVIQKSVNDPRYFEQSTLNQIDMPVAWDITTGSDIIIAVIDTGVNFGHEELAGKAWINSNEIPNNHTDDDGNGFVDDYNGYNFMSNNSDISDDNGHGTGIASVIAANTNNSRGMAGINWQAKIMALKALNSAGGGEYLDVADALRYAVNNGAKVINMSFGTYFDSHDLSSAVDYALDNGVTIIAAAGNNNQSTLLFPAGYDRVISVGAVDGSGDRTSFSNYGSNLDMMAPGINVLMAGPSGSNAYVYGSGTSFAAAHVTGVVSLMLARNSSLNPVQIESILKENTKGANNLSEHGYGIVNSVKALLATEVLQDNTPVTTQPIASADQYGAQWVNQSRPGVVHSGENIELWVELRNTGNAPWYGSSSASTVGQVRLGTSYPHDRNSRFRHISWMADNRVATATTSVIAPGQIAKFNFTVSAPAPGEYREYFNPVIEYVSWLPDLGIYWDITVVDSGVTMVADDYQLEIISQSKDVILSPGEIATLELEIRNNGSVTWQPAGNQEAKTVKLGTANPRDRASSFYGSNWLSKNRVTDTVLEVPPNAKLNISFSIKAPSNLGQYSESFRFVSEYVTWFGPFITWEITVQ